MGFFSRNHKPTYTHKVKLRRGIGDLSVVGEQHYLRTIKKALRRSPDANNIEVALSHEPENRHDRNAIRVDIVIDMSGGNQLLTAGYLPADVAPEYVAALKSVWDEQGLPVAPAKVWLKGDIPQVYIKMGTPGILVPPRIDDPKGVFVDGTYDLTVTGEEEYQHILKSHPQGKVLAFSIGDDWITKGKYKDQATFAVRLNGQKIGQLTRRMAEKHGINFHPLLAQGFIPYLAGRLEADHRGVQAILDAPPTRSS
ncbi:MAG: hypothetical protein ACTHXA_01755 [Gulosibacter sp.]|uniref:hypothetical protein n=1 Tax=Gulosibacter sp. TaxID=2817531 RepID=UPI003F8F1117